MKIVYAFVLLVLSNLLLCGCVETRPLISHAHLGHVMTAWHDTPHQRGLLAVARDEADTALLEAERVWMQGVNSNSAGKHVKKVILALNPDLLPGGNWRKQHYGVIRALEGTLDHLEYAANSKDASLNMVSGVAILVGQGGQVINRFKDALATAQSNNAQLKNNPQFKNQRIAAAFKQASLQLRDQLQVAINGEDLDGDGVVGSHDGEFGLKQLEENLQQMLQNESAPPYEPVSRRYVLGLIKLPNGRWDFDFSKIWEKTWNKGGRGYY